MKLSKLLQSIEYKKINGSGDPEISGIHYDSRTVKPGGLFFALKGATVDGHTFIPAAIANGAVAVVVEDDLAGYGSLTVVKTTDSRVVMARAAAGCRVARPAQSSSMRRSSLRLPSQATTPKAPTVLKV